MKIIIMKKPINGLFLGVFAGVIDLIPMVIQKLTWDANLSAFSMWVVAGFFISATDIKMKPFLKGIIIALLVLLPSSILIGSKEPFSLIPITLMTIFLWGFLGYSIDKTNQRTAKV
jgi:hypothetical protein